MPHVVKDRVMETTASTGTGTITLGGAVAGYQSFSVIGNANTTYYTIVGGTEWEVGIGTYTSSGTTLSRDTVLESSNGGSLVNFSAGTKNVFVTYPAEESVDIDTPQTLINKTFSSSIPINGSTSGSVTLQAPAVAGTTVLTLPAVSGQVTVFPSGTRLLFQQTSAPTGWTKDTTHNNKAMRVVSGTAGSGGSVDFTTAFASQTPTGSVSVGGSVGSTTLSTSQVPNAAGGVIYHGAGSATVLSGVGGAISAAGARGAYRSGGGNIGGATSYDGWNLNLGFGGGSHNHSFSGSGSFSGNAINLAVQYVDVIIATKD